MTFRVNGIKQDKDTKNKIELLVITDSDLLIRKVLEKIWIIILSIKEYKQDLQKFWNIFFKIRFWMDEVQFISNITNLKDACLFFMSAGFQIIDINYLTNPITANEVKKIMELCSQQALQIQEQFQQKIQEEKTYQTKIYSDSKLTVTKEVIQRIFEKINEVRERVKWNVSVLNLKRLKELEDDLKKLRMWTNTEKMKDDIHQIFQIIENIENEYYDSLKENWKEILPDSLVTDLEISRELDRLENITKIKKLWLHIPYSWQDYSIFGRFGIVWKFLQRDFIYKISNLTNVFYSLYDLFELVIITMVFLLWVYIVINPLFLFSEDIIPVYFSLINLGTLWFITFFTKFFRRKNLWRLIILVPFIIIIYYILINIVNTNFAL